MLSPFTFHSYWKPAIIISSPQIVQWSKVTASNKAHHFHFPLVWSSEPILDGLTV